MRRSLAISSWLMIAISCAHPPDHELNDWRMVLARKKAITRAGPAGLTVVRQTYIDSLREFCRRYPKHRRAREVYLDAEIEHARELLARGDYATASVFYKSALRDRPGDEILREFDEATRRRFITPQALQALHRGMRQREVAGKIGSPPEGWTRSFRKGNRTVMSWYYPRQDGGVAGVHFLDGRLFAAEYNRAIRLRNAG